jgi:hypothetical protein
VPSPQVAVALGVERQVRAREGERVHAPRQLAADAPQPPRALYISSRLLLRLIRQLRLCHRWNVSTSESIIHKVWKAAETR